MKKSFEKIYNELSIKNKLILEQLHKNSLLEKKRRKKLLKKYIVLPTIIVCLIQIIYCFKRLFPSLTLWIVSIIGDIVIYVIIVNKNINNYIRYKRKIKINVIFKLIENFFNNVDYIPNKIMSKEVYDEAGFVNYNRYSADDYIEGYVDDKHKIIMANVVTTVEDSDSAPLVTFDGLFAKVNLRSSINNSIKICNYKNKSEEKIDLDFKKFEEMFEVTSDNNIKVMQLLTTDVMELLIEFSKFINSKFDISIINNNIYIRINNNTSFEACLNENEILDKEQMEKYYETLNFIYNLSLYIIKWIEESYITE